MSKDKIKKVAKFAAKLGVTSSVSKVVHDVIDAHVAAETPIQQIQVWVGAAAISMYATAVTWDHLESEATKLVHSAQEIKTDHEATEAA